MDTSIPDRNEGVDEPDLVRQVFENDRRPQNHRNHQRTAEEYEMQSLGSRTSRDSQESQSGSEESSEWEEEDLKYKAQRVVMLFAPVSLCMIVVVVIVNVITFYKEHTVAMLYTPFKEDKETFTGNFLSSLYNALIVLAVVAVMTFALVLLYKYKCGKIIQGWLFTSSLIMLFFFTYNFFQELLKNANLPVDLITMALIIWNLGFIGMFALFYRAPLRVQQFYLIVISALMALTFIKYLPQWTTWTILAIIAAWDLVAVLTPCGPLKMLVETARKRDEPIFEALIYSTTATILVNMADWGQEAGRDAGHGEQQPLYDDVVDSQQQCNGSEQRSERSAEERSVARSGSNASGSEQDEPPRGPQLGLGDFIFYSLLVGRASTHSDWNTTIACFIAILVGLCLTLLLLAAFADRLKALPALPISIALGLLFYFGTRYVITPFTNVLAANQIYI